MSRDGETVERLYLEAGEPLAKWTGTALTYPTPTISARPGAVQLTTRASGRLQA
ncbi:MAG: hypothetical protein WBF53_02400 [Litorimonas sp.]